MGPLSKPLRPGAEPRGYYDTTACVTMDEIGGVGWSWPSPERDGFWSDRADARLLLPIRRGADHLLVVWFSAKRAASAAPLVDVYVNGRRLAFVDFRTNRDVGSCVVHVSKRLARGDWLELSFRPREYSPQMQAALPYAARVSVPLRGVDVVRLDDRAGKYFDDRALSSLASLVLRGEEPYFSKFEKIKKKIATSPLRDSAELPPGFDAVRYVLHYHDLLMAEVDPFDHYLRWGKEEGRVWR